MCIEETRVEHLKELDEGKSDLNQLISFKFYHETTDEVCWVVYNATNHFARRAASQTFGKMIEKLLLDPKIDHEAHTGSKLLICIFPLQKNVSDAFHTKAESLSFEKGIHIQLFSIDELQYDISEHILVPKHEKMPNDFFECHLRDAFHLETALQLPQIQTNDPLARYIGLKRNDICKITRPSTKTGESVVYRICV